jgi:hypothetical protein
MIRQLFLVIALFLPATVLAERDATKVYMFGNSLVHHLSETEDHTNVPYWLGQMARADGRDLGVDGSWGFTRDYGKSLPPSPNWSFDGVKRVWRGGSDFGAAGFDAMILTPTNFIQYQAPDKPYYDDPDVTPLQALQKVSNWVERQSPDTRQFIYEGWADMEGQIRSFPPSSRRLNRYYRFNQGDYHSWYVDLVARMNQENPAAEVRLLPVGSILTQLVGRGGVLADLSATDLFTDDAPHGTATTYLLAAMITYSALYDVPPPSGFKPPIASIHPDLVEKYKDVAEAVWAAMPEVQALNTAVEQAPRAVAAAAEAEDLPKRQVVALPPKDLRPEGVPALGMGLHMIADWSTQHPFLDLMKTARPWVGHLPGQWGAVTTDQLRANGHLDENGWPLSIPDGAEAIETVFLTEQNPDNSALRGRYIVRYDGQGEVRLTGRAKRVRYAPGRIEFTYSPGEGIVGFQIRALPERDQIRNIRILRAEHQQMFEAGEIFNPDWLARVQDMRSLRFMDWMQTNGSDISRWEDRPRLSDATWVQWGVPIEVMIRLSNRVGADPWFNMPHAADDAYIRRFAEQVRDDLDPRLKAYVEYSNEVWNWVFPQADWAKQRALALWGDSSSGWLQYYALRAAQTAEIWGQVFGASADSRLVRVVATQTGWPGLEENILMAPLAYLKLGYLPQEAFDAYAVTGYFGYEIGSEDTADKLQAWLDQSEALATKAGEDQGLRRVALREFVKKTRFEAAIAPVTLELEQGSLRELTQELFPYHAGVADKAGLKLVMYEGGTHILGQGGLSNDDRVTAFLEHYNYTPEIAKLYEVLMGAWAQGGGTMFTAFVDVAPASKWGSWGSLRHLEDDNPRWDMLMAFNASGPNAWETRDPEAFANGVILEQTGSNQRLEGTAHEDVLLAGAGNDILVSGGGDDLLHGGDGLDRAVLPGAQSSYTFTRDNGVVFAKGPFGIVRLTAVETLSFEEAPDTTLDTAGL